jgi:hypothetical protein
MVRAVYLGAQGCMVKCRLLEDDTGATVPPFRAGECGWWHGRSFIEGPITKDAEE